MAFFDVMKERGYTEGDGRDKFYVFEKDRAYSKIVIFFNVSQRTINSFLYPSKLIKKMSSIKEIENDFRVMRDDVEYFLKLSGYQEYKD